MDDVIETPKRKRPVSMTQKARALCKERGWHYGQVDHRIPHTFIAQDLFNMFDAVVLDGAHLIGVQVTSGANHAARVEKIRENPIAATWLATGARIEVWSWSKLKPRGQARASWTWRAQRIEIWDLAAPPAAQPRHLSP